jgi:hypothetical protein
MFTSPPTHPGVADYGEHIASLRSAAHMMLKTTQSGDKDDPGRVYLEHTCPPVLCPTQISHAHLLFLQHAHARAAGAVKAAARKVMPTCSRAGLEHMQRQAVLGNCTSEMPVHDAPVLTIYTVWRFTCHQWHPAGQACPSCSHKAQDATGGAVPPQTLQPSLERLHPLHCCRSFRWCRYLRYRCCC